MPEYQPIGEYSVTPPAEPAAAATVVGIWDSRTGARARVSPSALHVQQPVRGSGGTFGSASDTRFWTLSTSGASSTATISGGVASVSADGSAGYGRILSSRKLRYVNGTPNIFRGSVRVQSGDNRFAMWGALDLDGFGWFAPNPSLPDAIEIEFDGGFFFWVGSYGGLNYLGIGHTEGQSSTKMGGMETALNGEVSEFILDDSYHSYEIIYSDTVAHFYVDDTHIGTINSGTAPFVVLNLAPGLTSYNIAGLGVPVGAGQTVESSSLSLHRAGPAVSIPQYAYITQSAPSGALKSSPGDLQRIIASASYGVLTLYDDVSAVAGNEIMSIDLATTHGQLIVNCPFEVGLYYTLSGNGKLTVFFE